MNLPQRLFIKKCRYSVAPPLLVIKNIQQRHSRWAASNLKTNRVLLKYFNQSSPYRVGLCLYYTFGYSSLQRFLQMIIDEKYVHNKRIFMTAQYIFRCHIFSEADIANAIVSVIILGRA